MNAEIQRILDALSAIRVSAQPEEYEIHAAVARALEDAGIPCIHECPLMPRCRIDFLCGSVGIEVKKSKPDARRLKQQLERYLESDRLTGIIVVLQKSCSLPAAINSKPVHILALNRLWGVALH